LKRITNYEQQFKVHLTPMICTSVVVFTSEGESDNSTDSFYFSDNNLTNLLSATELFHHHHHSCILLHISILLQGLIIVHWVVLLF